METFEGVGDRIRIAAFAELQAVHGFRYGAAKFQDAPKSLRSEWLGLALAEERHLGWLTTRAKELGVRLDERPVSEDLWRSLVGCRSAEEFAWYMSHAEERGRLAGERFSVALAVVDPESASIFRRIAEEEVAHVELASRYFPNSRWSTEARTLMRQKVMGQ
jgi:rubrerythrin